MTSAAPRPPTLQRPRRQRAGHRSAAPGAPACTQIKEACNELWLFSQVVLLLRCPSAALQAPDATTCTTCSIQLASLRSTCFVSMFRSETLCGSCMLFCHLCGA